MKAEIKPISPKDIVFDYRTQGKCFSCPHYGKKGTCPPRIDRIHWRYFIQCYSVAYLYKVEMEYGETTPEGFVTPLFEHAREETAKSLLDELLKAEREEFSKGHYWVHSFTGGSCRGCDCKDCGDGCRFPMIGRIPMEGAGIDVMETCRIAGMKLPPFPHPKPDGGTIARVGLLLVE